MSRERTKNATLKAVPKAPVPTHDVPSDNAGLCPKCHGIGMEIVPGKGARRCSCREATREVERADLGFPKRYQTCTFENYDYKNPSQKQAMRVAFTLASQFPAVNQGLLLSGPVGVGKTHLAVSIAKLLRDRGIPCIFCEFGTLLKQIRDSYNPATMSSELAILEPILRVDVLVLDELGASKPTDWVRETLYHIINTRYNENRVSIFTTNFPDDYDDHRKETLEERIGVPIRSRLYQMCRTVILKGEDYRRSFDPFLTARTSS